MDEQLFMVYSQLYSTIITPSTHKEYEMLSKNKKLYLITHSIRNLRILSYEDIDYIKSLNCNEMMYIISLYNLSIISVNEFIIQTIP